MYGRSLQMWLWGSAIGSFILMLGVLLLTPVWYVARSWYYRLTGDISVVMLLIIGSMLVCQVGAMLLIAVSDNLSNSGWDEGVRGMLRYAILSSRVERRREGSWQSRRRDPEDYAGAMPWSGIGSGCISAVSAVFLWFTVVAVPDELATLATMYSAWKDVSADAAASAVRKDASGKDASGKDASSKATTSLASAGASLAAVNARDLGRDAFGRPIARDQAASSNAVRLRSLGVDSQPSKDDLCVSHFFNPRVGNRWVDAAQFAQAVKADRLTLNEKFDVISDAECWDTF